MDDGLHNGNDPPLSDRTDASTESKGSSGHEVGAPLPTAGIASLSHWSFLMSLVVPPAVLVLPLVLLFTVGKEDRFVAENAKEALNLLIASAIAAMCFALLIVVVIGAFMLVALSICLIVFPIIAAVQTMSSTESTPVYRYPLIFRLIT